MKKLLLLMLTLLTFGFAAAPVSAQNTLTVADGTASNAYVPFYGYYLDASQHCQVIYPDSMLTDMQGLAITQMEFYLNDNPSFTSTITFKMGISTDATFSSASFDATTSLTEVYVGAIVIANNIMTVEFSEPFTYNGGNLLLDFTNTTGNYLDNIYFSGIASPGSSVSVYSSWGSLTLRDFIPKTTFSYGTPPLCSKPTNVMATGVTTTDATISWTGDGSISYYNIEYMPSSQTDWANAVTATAYTETYNLTGLQPSSAYKVRVQSVCSDNSETNWSSVCTFQTSCDVITFTDSWTEDFEGYSGSGQQPFQCWATPVTFPSGGPFVYCGYAQACHSGMNSAELKGYDNAMNMIVLPEFTNPLNTLRLTFWATSTNVSQGILEVGVMTDASDTSTFELVGVCGMPGARGSAEGVAGNGNLMGPFDFNNVSATSGRIALRYTANFGYSYDQLSWNLDDFTVTNIPACAEPTGLATMDVTTTTADITWNAVDGESYYVTYWEEGAVDSFGINNAALTDGVLQLNLLSPNTTYSWYVSTICSDGSFANSFQTMTFTTPNVPVALPYEQNFETFPEDITDFTIQGSGSNQWVIGSAAFMPVDPTDSTETGHSLYISNDNGATNNYSTSSTSNAYAILDVEFGDTPMEYHLTFDYKLEGEGTSYKYDYLSVYLVDGNVTVPINGIPSGIALLYQSNFVSDWTHADYILENVTGTAKKIVFYWSNDSYGGTNPPAAVDNIAIIGSTCAQPNQLTATAITVDGADLSWNEVGTATSWTVYYKAVADESYTAVPVSGTATTTLTGLTADTYYTYYVVADCDGAESNPSNEYMFRTACGAITLLPYTNAFEDAIAFTDGASGDFVNFVPCWSRLASNISNVVYHFNSSTYAHGGSGCLDFNWTGGEWTTAIMPAFDASIPVNTLMVEFWLDKTGSSGTFEVGVMTDPSDSTSFELVETVNSTISGNSAQYYEQHIVSLASYTGNGQYIAFRASNAASCGFRMDDIVVSEIPQCMHPTALHTTSVGSDEVSIAWTELGDATSWTVAYGAAGFDPDEGEGATASANETALTITGLTSGSTYDIYVMSGCGSDWEGPLTVVVGQYILNATGSDTLTTCGAVLYDDGGPTSDYSTNCNSTLVIYPATPDMMVMLTGTASFESGYDHLYIYDGVGTNGTQLAHFTGENQTVNVMSTTGPLTLNYTSDYLINKSGFELEVSCVSCFPPTNISITDATMTSATVSWSGLGDGYGVYVSGPDTNYYYTTGTTLDLTGLAPSSTYSVSIFTLCSSGDTSILSQPVSFNTSCGAITITEDTPWFENFEEYGTSGGAVPVGACWATPEMQQVDNGVSPFVYCGYSGSAYSGVSTLEMKGGPTMVVFPEFSNDINTLRISMWGNTTAYNASDAGNMVLGYISNISDPTTFVPVDTIPATAFNRTGTDSPHADIIGPYDLNGVTPQAGLRIALRLTDVTTSATGASTSWNLDDITISLIPACPSPVKTSVQATNISGHSATITWVDNDPTHNYWTVYYKAADDFLWETALAGPTPSADLYNLNPETTYEVYVVTDCGSYEEYPDETQHINFTTLVACPAPQNISVSNIGMSSATVTWFSDANSFTIEYGEAGFTPGSGTTMTSTTSSINLTGLTSGTAYTVYVTADCGGTDGSSSAASVNFNTNMCDVADQCTYTFNLADGYGDGWGTGSLAVQQNGITVATVTLSDGNTGTETVNLCDNVSTSLVWTSGGYFDYEASFSLLGPDGVEIYSTIAMDNYTTYTFTTDCSGSGPVITNPTVTTTPATGITQTTAQLNGTVNNPSNVNIEPMGFEWKAASAMMYNVVNQTNTPLSFTLYDLLPGTQYTYRAFITYNGVTYYGDDVNFTTLEEGVEPCDAPTNLQESGIIFDKALGLMDVIWEDNGGASQWNLQYRLETESDWTTVTVNEPHCLLQNLVGQATYVLRVQAVCDNGTLSDWSNTLIATAQSVGIENWLEKTITLFPNPAREYVDIRIDGDVNVTNMEVFDVYGKLINTVNVIDNPTRINVNGLADGMYFVRVTTDKGMVTKTFVKK